MKGELSIYMVASLILVLVLLLAASLVVINISGQAANGTSVADPSGASGLIDDIFPPELSISSIEAIGSGKDMVVDFEVESPLTSSIDVDIEVASIPADRIAQERQRELLQSGTNEFAYSLSETGQRPYYLIIRIFTKSGKFVVSRGKYLEPAAGSQPTQEENTVADCGCRGLYGERTGACTSGCPCQYGSDCTSGSCSGSDEYNLGACD